jgi:hypothetical protein
MFWFSALALFAAQADRAIVVEADRLSKDGATMICKHKPPTNTRFATRTCHTRAEWDTIAEQNRRGAEEWIGGMKANPCSSGDDYVCDMVRGQ